MFDSLGKLCRRSGRVVEKEKRGPASVNAGYIKLWRKITEKPDWPGNLRRSFTDFEARVDVYMNLARGKPEGHLGRGEFEASVRFLARRWRWGSTKVHRWKQGMIAEGELKRVEHQTEHQTEHLKVCHYNVYNPMVEHKVEHKVEQSKRRINEREKESPNGDSCRVRAEVLLDLYRKHNRILPQVKAFGSDRWRKCQSRINRAQQQGRLEPYLKDFAEAVKKAQQVPFLRGEGRQGWRASFDWFVANDSNVCRILEGTYDQLNQELIGKSPRTGGRRYTPKQ